MGWQIRALGGASEREPTGPNAVPSCGLPFVVFGFAMGARTRRSHCGPPGRQAVVTRHAQVRL
ncbi:hypothetical protein GCM10018966_028120 [Streptomyces yanii]